MVTIKVDRRVLILLVGVLALGGALGAGIWLGRDDSAVEQAPAPIATQPLAIVQEVPGTAPEAVPPADDTSDVPRISLEDAAALLGDDNVVFVDARNLQEYEIGHIPAAMLIPVEEAPQRFAEVPRDKKIITYCA
jgi:hypothetical protein